MYDAEFVLGTNCGGKVDGEIGSWAPIRRGVRPRLHDRFFLGAENTSCKWPQFADFSSSRDPRRKADMLAFRRGKLVV